MKPSRSQEMRWGLYALGGDGCALYKGRGEGLSPKSFREEKKKKGNAEGRTNRAETWFYYFHFTYEETEDQRG